MFKYFLLGITAGFALGISAALILDISSSPEKGTSIPESVNVTYQDEELKRNLGDLSKAVSKLNQLTQNLPGTLENILAVAKKQNSSAEPDSIEKSKAIKSSSDWTKFILPRLANRMVIAGKTPYDPGVSPLLQEAIKKLSISDERASQNFKDLDNMYWQNGKPDKTHPDYKMYEEEKRKIYKQWDEDEKQILDDFRSALESLKEKN